ncbi:hypothetical protein HaLaN_13197 [Haematococcus lacustris]|uniref:Uncharacterized protein n=1 Tax=Haematococcus lacustris TaxID=44745 RepID=A0A699ZBS7_HAELA|nr:hypothetical protein HaLaN_13197 [Haematococcus lacustris]
MDSALHSIVAGQMSWKLRHPVWSASYERITYPWQGGSHGLYVELLTAAWLLSSSPDSAMVQCYYN